VPQTQTTPGLVVTIEYKGVAIHPTEYARIQDKEPDVDVGRARLTKKLREPRRATKSRGSFAHVKAHGKNRASA